MQGFCGLKTFGFIDLNKEIIILRILYSACFQLHIIHRILLTHIFLVAVVFKVYISKV